MTVNARASRRDWLGLAILMLPCLLISMDLSVLNLAVPQLSADLRPTSSQLLWITDSYGFLIAGALITMGTLGDRIGRRRLLLIGAGFFGLASVLAAFSPNAESLILSRALLGLAGATLMPSTLSLIRSMFADAKQRAVAIGAWTTSFAVGGALGPFLGGLLLEHYWWGSVFLLAVPVMALLLVVGPLVLPEFRSPGGGRFDLPGAALSLFAVLAVIYGIKQLAEHGSGWRSWLAIVIGLLVGAAFVRRQRRLGATADHRLPEPLLDLRMFRVPSFTTSLVVNLLSFFVMFGMLLLLAQYLQLVLGLSPLVAGLWTVPSAVGYIVGSLMTPLLGRRLRPATVMGLGLAVAAAGFAVILGVGALDGLSTVVIGSVVFSVGLAPVYIVATDLVIASAPAERAGSAAAVSETAVEFGGALGIAILGSVGTVVYRNQTAGTFPAEVPEAAAETARGTLGGAVEVRDSLSEHVGTQLIEAARAAFTEAMEVATGLSAAVMALAAVATVVVLRRRPAPEPQASGEAS